VENGARRRRGQAEEARFIYEEAALVLGLSGGVTPPIGSAPAESYRSYCLGWISAWEAGDAAAMADWLVCPLKKGHRREWSTFGLPALME
jgi:hypothetical protein